MNITRKMANSIVNQISETINKNVNFMDENGIIIASKNYERIGTLHFGAQKIINEKLGVLSIDNDKEFTGSKIGVNLPISFRGKVVGVIGISGEWRQMEQYIQLIQKTAESMIFEFYINEKEKNQNSELQEYLFHVLFGKIYDDKSNIIEKGISLGINIDKPRRCFSVTFVGVAGKIPIGIQNTLIDFEHHIKHHFDNTNELFIYRDLSRLNVFLPVINNEYFFNKLNSLKSTFELNNNLSMRIGVDCKENSGEYLRVNLAKAQKSLAYAITENKDIVLYDDMTYGIFVSELNPSVKDEFILKIFAELDQEEIESWVNLLDVFYECEGSLAESASKLFVHKNTLQYQLKKLAVLTGRDPRNISNAGLYQTAIAFWKEKR